MEWTFICTDFLVDLLRMNLVDLLWSNCCGVHCNDMERSGWFRLTRLSDGNLEMPECGRMRRPDGTEEALLLAVEISKAGRAWIGREKGEGALDRSCVSNITEENRITSSHSHSKLLQAYHSARNRIGSPR
jgi:hypothetical protein